MEFFTMSVRVPLELKNNFEGKCTKEYGQKYQVMVKEIMEAFIDNRLTITPNRQQKNRGKLYGE